MPFAEGFAIRMQPSKTERRYFLTCGPWCRAALVRVSRANDLAMSAMALTPEHVHTSSVVSEVSGRQGEGRGIGSAHHTTTTTKNPRLVRIQLSDGSASTSERRFQPASSRVIVRDGRISPGQVINNDSGCGAAPPYLAPVPAQRESSRRSMPLGVVCAVTQLRESWPEKITSLSHLSCCRDSMYRWFAD